MSFRLGLISDIHASTGALAAALDLFDREQVDDILCAGDIAGYFDALEPSIDLLERKGCKTILGNHDESYLETHRDDPDSPGYRYLSQLPRLLNLNIAGKDIYCVHAEPPAALHGGIKLLDQEGKIRPQQHQHWRQKLRFFKHDVLIVGHTHQVFAEWLGNILAINPGSTVFNHSCMILDLPELEVHTFALERQEIIPCWNFSMLYGSATPYPKPSPGNTT